MNSTRVPIKKSIWPCKEQVTDFLKETEKPGRNLWLSSVKLHVLHCCGRLLSFKLVALVALSCIGFGNKDSYQSKPSEGD